MAAEESETWTPEDEPPKASGVGVYNPLEFLYDDEEDPGSDDDPKWWMWAILIVISCLATPLILSWELIKWIYKAIRNWALSTDSTID